MGEGPELERHAVVVVCSWRRDDGGGRPAPAFARALARDLGGAAAVVEMGELEPGLVEGAATALAELVSRTRPQVLLLPDDDGGRQLAPLVAYRLGTSAVLGCSDMSARDRAAVCRQPVYGGWLERELSFAPGSLAVATVAPTLLESPGVDTSSPHAVVLAVIDPPPPAHPSVRRLELLPPDFRTVDLVHARRVVTAGVGGAGEELLPLVEELAELLQASLGSTRPVVDEGRLPKDRLIGQTGRTVHPDLYLSLGVSGSPHHVAGVQEAGTFLSVDRDPRAPVFGYSDAGYLGDLELIVPGLVRRIKEWRDGLEG